MNKCPECEYVSSYGRENYHSFECSKNPDFSYPTKLSGWESSFNDAFLLRKNKWGAPKLAKYFPQQLHPDLVKDFIRSLLREKAGEIRGMMKVSNRELKYNEALVDAIKLLEN